MGSVARLAPPMERAEYHLLDNTTFNVGQLAASYGRSASRFYLRRFGLSVAEVRVLNIVGHYEPVAAARVSDISLMDKALVSRAVAKLAKLGLLERATDDADGRRQILTLTDEGKRSWSGVLAAKQSRHDRLLAGLGAAEMRLFNELLGRLQADAERIEREEAAEAPAA